jgi:hypothetical protein
MLETYVGCRASTTVLEQEAHVRREGAKNCKKNSELKHWPTFREVWSAVAFYNPHR